MPHATIDQPSLGIAVGNPDRFDERGVAGELFTGAVQILQDLEKWQS